MSWLTNALKKPTFIFAVVLPITAIAEFAALESFVGISFPWDRGSAISSYEIREKGKELHFITRNKRFSIDNLWSQRCPAHVHLLLPARRREAPQHPYEIDSRRVRGA